MPSSTADASNPVSVMTAAAASMVNPPAKTARRRSNRRSVSGSSSWLQSSVARSVRCRGSAVRRPAVNSAKRSRKPAATP